jgi:eukaryotic-like serine/threonine-protein kinase
VDAAQLSRIQALFHEAADLAPTEQQAFARSACGEDRELLGHLLSMLDEDAQGGSLLDGNIAQVAHDVLAEDSRFPRGLPNFGPYRIQRVLGEGGMGIVYLAERDDLQTQVAIKVLRGGWLSRDRHQRFVSEQRTLARLIHPSIARLYDAGLLPDGTPFFVMEYVDGLPLTEYCRRHQCSLAKRLELFRSVCEAVLYAHQHAIIHRDLKPSNIFVKEDGTIRLLDFGIAKQIESFDESAEQTRTELCLMTPSYAAPEQIRGEQVGVFTDVYALGIILYELLADCFPFNLQNRSLAEIQKIVLEQTPEKPSVALQRGVAIGQLAPSLLPGKAEWMDLDILCLTALHKDIQRRYRSVEALIRDVDHYTASEPLDARPDSIRYRLGKFLKRNRNTVAGTAVLLVISISVTVFFTMRLAAAHNAVMAAAARTQRIQRFMFDLFEGGDKSAAPAEDLRVLTLVNRGVQEAQSLDREPEVQADLYDMLGRIYQNLGNFSRADQLLRRALDQRKRSSGTSGPETAQSLLALGLLRIDQARFEEAEKLINDGFERTRKAKPPDLNALAQATAIKGKLREARGDYQEAIRLLNEAVTFQSGSGTLTPELAANMKELADANFYAGHYDLSESLTRRVMALHRQLVGEHHPLVADDLIDLGAVQYERGFYREAERFYRQALDIDQSWYGKDHPETAAVLYMLGEALVGEKRLDEAELLLEKALAIRERAYGAQHPRVAHVLNELCRVASAKGQMDKAEACYQRVIAIYKTAYSDHHYQVALGVANLASVYLDKGEFARAEKLFREVIERYRQTLSPDHLYVGIAQIKLGRCLLRQNHYAEAELHSRTGYEIVKKQASPSVSWLRLSRNDLAVIYGKLGKPDKAAEFSH